MNNSTQPVPIVRFTSFTAERRQDVLTVEEPLGIRIRYGMALQSKDLSITMRTPGHDEELALGFLLSEGIITHRDQVVGATSEGPNQVTIILHEAVAFDPTRFERHVYTTSSCGICGKASLDAVRIENTQKSSPQTWTIPASVLYQLPALLRQQQADFSSTGGLHASALFDADGQLLLLREDVGRHNALDKLIGSAMQNDWLPLHSQLLLLSGRASFELIQKAGLAGISFVASVGAPSNLAVALAHEMDITLVGFLRDNRFNVYTHPERILEN
jgi:FdhD protein